MCRLIGLVECVGMCSSEITEANTLNTLLYSNNDKVRGGGEGEEREFMSSNFYFFRC